MAQRLSLWYCPPILATLFLLLAAQLGPAQSTILPAQPPGTAPKPAESTPAAKELSTQEVDGLIEKAFGNDCAELTRPIRMWIADVGMVIAAMDLKVTPGGGSVRLTKVSIGFVFEAKVLRGEQVEIVPDLPVTQLNELGDRRIRSIELRDKTSVVTLTSPNPNGFREIIPNKTGVTPTPGLPQPMEMRFKFNIDSKALLSDLLPTPSKTQSKLPNWANEDLARVPELTFGEPISKELSKYKAMEATAHVMAKINHLNRKKTDGFMLVMMDQRPDLRGLPFLMGDDCRSREEQAKAFAHLATTVRTLLPGANVDDFWSTFASVSTGAQQGEKGPHKAKAAHLNSASVAVFLQILMPESASLRTGLAKHLATVPHIDASKALAKLAIFAPEDEVRAAAIDGLKLRRERDYTGILMQGFRYPLPAVSKRAAEALVKLERKDLLANLIEVLESPDPRLPVTEKQGGKGVTFVRELVKVNHHRNCLLCHAPGNTDNTPEGVLKVAVPLPGEPLPKPSEGGYQSTPPPTPDIVVRLDMTYLRQDFAQMMPVKDAHPWPEMQRFDFLVRTRTLTAAEAQAYEPCCEAEEPGRLSPYHRAALYALRELTGRDTEPSAAAWRKLLKLAK